MRTRLILILMLLTTGWCVSAQPVTFNKLYTLNSTAAYFNALQVREHGYMGMSTVVDSGSNRQGLRITRFDDSGNVKANGLFYFPDTLTSTYAWYKAFNTVNDNFYITAGDLVKWDTSGNVVFSKTYLLKSDSNGQPLNNVFVPKNIISNDSLVYTRAVQYDGKGNLLVLSIAHVPPSTNLLNPVYRFLLSKYDTSLNLIWQKDYAPLYGFYTAGGIIIEQDGYTMFGGYANRHLYYENDKNYRSRAVMMKVDTAGTLLWNYETPADSLFASISDVIKTADEGYVYATQGNTYDHNSQPIGTADWRGQDLIIKINSIRIKQWQTQVDKRFGTFGYAGTEKIIQLRDSSIAITIAGADSIPPLNTFGIGLYTYTKDGILRSRKAYLPPDITFNTNGIVRLHDMALANDNGFVLVGECLNQTPTYPPPYQRSWMVKVDSNGCLGNNDPQCWKVGITQTQEQKPEISVFPNPAYDYLQVSTTLKATQIVLTLSDITGKALLQQSVRNGTRIDIIGLPPGLYVYRMLVDGIPRQAGKIIKE